MAVSVLCLSLRIVGSRRAHTHTHTRRVAQLLQGTIAPTVNAGPQRVCDVFLADDFVRNNCPDAHKLRASGGADATSESEETEVDDLVGSDESDSDSELDGDATRRAKLTSGALTARRRRERRRAGQLTEPAAVVRRHQQLLCKVCVSGGAVERGVPMSVVTLCVSGVARAVGPGQGGRRAVERNRAAATADQRARCLIFGADFIDASRAVQTVPDDVRAALRAGKMRAAPESRPV